MTKPHHATDLQMIPVDQIAVLNPRDRNGRVFEEIVGNIKSLGLKKPVTVTPRGDLEDGKRYLLICGEGRLKAFKSLGEKEKSVRSEEHTSELQSHHMISYAVF